MKVGSYSDRFVTEDDADAWLRSGAAVLRRGRDGVEIPGGVGVVRIPEEPCGSWSGHGDRGDLYDIQRPSAKSLRASGWPSLTESTALIAFREDGKVYVVAEPADPDHWITCHVFDTATGYHLHTIRRYAPR